MSYVKDAKAVTCVVLVTQFIFAAAKRIVHRMVIAICRMINQYVCSVITAII